MKKVISMLLIVAMMMSLSVCAFAADTQMIDAAGADNSLTGSASVKFTGKVEEAAVLLSVVMPTVIEFTVATKNYTGSAKLASEKGTLDAAPTTTGGKVYNTMVSGKGTVTNNSNVAINLDISAVAEDSNLLDLIDFAVKSDELTRAEALTNPLKVGDADVRLHTGLAAGGATTTLEAVGAAAQGTFSGTNYEVNVVDGSYVIITTMKVSVYSA